MFGGWSFGWRTVSFGTALVCALLGATYDSTLTAKGAGIGVALLAAGVPGIGHIKSPVLVWIAHILFWLPIVAWLGGRARGVFRRSRS